jgi:hypothetical protein
MLGIFLGSHTFRIRVEEIHRKGEHVKILDAFYVTLMMMANTIIKNKYLGRPEIIQRL